MAHTLRGATPLGPTCSPYLRPQLARPTNTVPLGAHACLRTKPQPHLLVATGGLQLILHQSARYVARYRSARRAFYTYGRNSRGQRIPLQAEHTHVYVWNRSHISSRLPAVHFHPTCRSGASICSRVRAHDSGPSYDCGCTTRANTGAQHTRAKPN